MNENAVAKATPSASQRFTDMVMREFTNSTGMVKISDHQRSLIQGYFIACDNALQEAEQKRQRDASGKGDFAKEAAARTPYTWENVNIGAKLAQKVVVYAKLGLDMTLPNNLFCIPRMNGKIGKYDLNFQEGYRGKEIKTKNTATILSKTLLMSWYIKRIISGRSNAAQRVAMTLTNLKSRTRLTAVI